MQHDKLQPMASDAPCALCGEPIVASRPSVLVHVYDPERGWPMRVHGSCLTGLLIADVPPLPANRTRIPGDAACGVCGGRLPVVGRHPFALTVDEAGPGRKWFVHADWFPDSMRARMSNPQNLGPLSPWCCPTSA
jgi:hypothetical protein